jgi:hypothetical protein
MDTDDKIYETSPILERTETTEQSDEIAPNQEEWLLFPLDEAVLEALLAVGGLRDI